MLSFVLSKQSSSPIGQFNVTPDFLYLNWTNNYTSNITIEIYNSSYANISVKILNSSSVLGNYSQVQSNQNCIPSNYHLFVVNTAGEYNDTIGPINESVNVTVLNTNYVQCKPGRYWVQKFTTQNAALDNETANITVYIDIPVSSSTTTSIGDFNGVLIINSTTYHPYYFNTSFIPNATGIKINISWSSSSQDVDLFLLDNLTTPTLKAKSINTTTSESLLYNYLPQGMMWEIRIYGNSTQNASYSGNIIFTTLNVTNTSDVTQQVSSINFGNMNVNETKQVNITLKNEGNLTLSSVSESKELYFIRTFGGTGPKNFTLLVPSSSIASKVKASLNWTGSSNYSLRIYNQNDSLLVTSTNKHVNANITGVMQEEYNETTNIGSSAGLWKFEVSNSSVSTNPYNLTVYIYVSPSSLVTNYTNPMTFNRTGNNNYTTDVQINFTVQNNSFDGSCEGYIQYLDNNGAGIKIPISLNVRTPMLVVNNSLVSMTSTINENSGINHTRSVNFFLNNTGYYNLSLILTNSSGILTCFSGCGSGYFANLNYNQTTSINNYSSQVLNVNITYNSSMSDGVYEGWVLINGSNSTPSLSSHPYETFNLTLRINLTKNLDIRNYGITSAVGGDNIIGNASAAENVTLSLKIYYVNGTEIESENRNALNASNFTVWLTHKNMSSYRIPPTGGSSLDKYNQTPMYVNDYSLIATVPANYPGGTYDVHVIANYTKSASAVYGGEGFNQTLIINSTGVSLSAISSTTISMDESAYSYFNITVINYGPLTANGNLVFSNSSCSYADIAAYGTSNCTGATISGNTWTNLGLNGNGTKVCYFAWKITGFNVTNDRTCSDLQVTYSEPNLANITGITIRVYDLDTGGTTTTTVSSDNDNGNNQQTTTTTTVPTVKYLNITSYPSTVSVAQGTNKTENVTVKNIHVNITQKVKLTIMTINSTWYSIYPSSEVTIANKSSYTYNITFMILENETVKDYSGKFFAESSYGGTTQSFTLKIIPGAKLQSQISVNLSNYQTEIQDLEKELNETKNKNNTEAKTLFNQLKEKFNQASNYFNQSDYRSAYDLLDDIESLLNQTKTALSGGTVGGKGIGPIDWKGLGKWIIVAVVAVVAIVLGYLFWPTSGGFKPLKGYSPQPKKEDKKTIIIGQFDKLKEKWKKAQESKE